MKIDHIAMYVQDLQGAKNFFETFFGGKASAEYRNPKSEFCSFFIAFENSTRLELMQRPEMQACPKDLMRTGYIHLAFSVGSKQAVDALTQRLEQAGYPVLSGPRTTGDGYYESCVLDGEGNQIEITE